MEKASPGETSLTRSAAPLGPTQASGLIAWIRHIGSHTVSKPESISYAGLAG